MAKDLRRSFETSQKDLKSAQNLQDQILILAETGKLTIDRIEYATAGRWGLDEIRDTVEYLIEISILKRDVIHHIDDEYEERDGGTIQLRSSLKRRRSGE